MDLNKAITGAADALRAVDLSALNDQYQNLAKELEEVRNAAKRADIRLAEIRERLSAGADGSAETVADALMAGVEADKAADLGPTSEALLTERETLRNAIKTLNERERLLRLQIADTEEETGQAVRAALGNVSGALWNKAREAATTLLGCFADASALEEAVRGNAGLVLACSQAAQGLTGSNKLLDLQRFVPVSPELVELQRAVQTLGPAMPKRQILAQTSMP